MKWKLEREREIKEENIGKENNEEGNGRKGERRVKWRERLIERDEMLGV